MGIAHRRACWLVAAGIATTVVLLVPLLDDGDGGSDGQEAPRSPELVRVNFQSPDAEVPDGYLRDFGEPYGPKAQDLTYGWVHEGTTVPVSIVSQGRDRDAVEDQREDTLVKPREIVDSVQLK